MGEQIAVQQLFCAVTAGVLLLRCTANAVGCCAAVVAESTASTSAQASTSARTGKVGSSSSGLHPLYPPLRANTEVWQLLAELYQQLQEEDVLAVIRTKHIIQCPGELWLFAPKKHGAYTQLMRVFEFTHLGFVPNHNDNHNHTTLGL